MTKPTMTTEKKSAMPPTALYVPAFCVGLPDTTRRLLPRVAKVWARRYQASSDFPEPETVLTAPGTLTFTSSHTDLFGGAGIQIYLVRDLLGAIWHELGGVNSETVWAAFDSAIHSTWWGALTLAVVDSRPDTPAMLKARIETLVRWWHILEQLRYVDFDPTPVSISSIAQSRYEGLMTMWSPQPTGDMRRDLQTSLAAFEAADAETRIECAARYLADIASTYERVHAKDKLTDIAFLSQELAEMEPEDRDVIAAGSSEALTFLVGTDRMLSGR